MRQPRLQSLLRWLAPRRRYVLPLAVVLVAGIFFLVQPAHAALDATGVFNAIIRAFASIFLVLGKWAIGMTIWGLEYFIKLAQYNNYIDSPVVAVGWVLVRDVANMFFVVALLMIAFGTILGLEQYQWNKTLIKLILSAVFINFSNLICGLFIDFAHVFTITFTNAIASAAGGNVIKMFHLDDVLNMVKTTPKELKDASEGDLQLDVLLAAFASFIFAVIAMGTMMAYLVIMVARVVMLWVLIVLSPLAFVLQVIPQTEQYAKQWWEKFGKQVVVAPVMVFFLWLAFATMGSGNFNTDVIGIPGGTEATVLVGTPAISKSQITSWENAANFFIPVVLLIVGLTIVQQLGVVGGGMAGGVIDFGKKVATIASGYAAGRWLAGQGWKGVKAGAKEFGKATVGDVGKRAWNRFQQWRTETPYIRAVPLLGGYGKIRREKLNEETEKALKLARENLSKTMGRPENISKADSVLYRLGIGGMKYLKEKRYKKEAEADVIDREKAETKRRRKAVFSEEQTSAADEVSAPVLEELKSEEGARVRQYAEEEGHRAAFGKVGEDFIAAERKKEIEETAKAELDADVDAKIRVEYEAGKGASLKSAAETAAGVLQTAREQYGAKYSSWQKEYVVTPDEGKKDFLYDGLSEFSPEQQALITARRKLWAKKEEVKKGDYDEGSDNYKKQTGEAIRQLLSEGVITVPQGSKLESELQGQFEASEKGKKVKTDVGSAESGAETAETNYREGLKNYKKALTKEAEGKLSETVKAEGGDIEARKNKAITQAVEAENSRRYTAATETFRASEEGKKFAKKAQKRIYSLADDVASGRKKVVDKEGKKMNASSRQAVAERIREETHRAEADTIESKQKAMDAVLRKAVMESPYGAQMLMLQNMEAQAKEAAEAFVEGLKNVDLEKRMDEAGKLLEKRLHAGGEAARKEIELSVYAQAAIEREKLVQKKEAMTIEQTTMQEHAKVYAVEKERYGVSTPSTSLVPVAERLTKDLKVMKESDSASFVADAISHLFWERKKKGGIDKQQHAFLFGSAMHLGRNGWMDDLLTEVTKRLNDLATGKITDPEMVEQLKNLRTIFVDQLGIVKKTDTGYLKDMSSHERVAKLEHLMVTGGDTDFISDHLSIEKAQKKAAAADSGKVTIGKGGKVQTVEKSDSYGTVMEKMSKAGQLIVGSAEEFKERMRQSEEFLQEANSFFRDEAFNTGHTEYGGHHQFDRELGAYRMATGQEAEKLMQAELRKIKNKLKYQYHGLGEADLEKGRLKTINSVYFNSQFEELTSALLARQVPERTIDAVLSYGFGHKKVVEGGYGVIGESEENIRENWGDAATYLREVVLRALRGNAESYKYITREKFQHVDKIDSDRGMAMIKIAGTGIKGKTYSQFLESVINECKKIGVALDKETEKILMAAISASRGKEATLGSKRTLREQSEFTAEENES